MKAWFPHQAKYIPNAVVLREQLAGAQGEEDCGRQTFEKPLWLPSQIKSQVSYDIRFAQIEWQLRVAQAYDAISSLRRTLYLRAHLQNFAKLSVRGQAAITRSQNNINTVQARVDANAEMYRAAQAALQSLAAMTKNSLEMIKYPVLNKEDIRELSEVESKTSEGRSTVSWIWKMEGLTIQKDHEQEMDGELNPSDPNLNQIRRD